MVVHIGYRKIYICGYIFISLVQLKVQVRTVQLYLFVTVEGPGQVYLRSQHER